MQESLQVTPDSPDPPAGPSSTVPLVSVVVACLNAAKTARQTLESVVNQKGSHAELIVIDGGSTDGTLDILEEFKGHFAYWTSSRDGGVYPAWNKALDHTRGEWIYFLGADDVLRADTVLTEIAPVLQSSLGTASVVYGRVAVLDEDGAEVAVAGRPWAEVSESFFGGRNLYHQGVFHHRSIFESRKFDTSFRLLGDYELLLNTLSKCPPVFAGDLVIAGYRAGGLSNRPQLMLTSFRETDLALRKHGYPRGAAEILGHFIRTLGWLALLSGANVVSTKLRKRLSRTLVQRASRDS